MQHAGSYLPLLNQELNPFPPAAETWSYNHWTTRKVPRTVYLIAGVHQVRYQCDIKNLTLALPPLSIHPLPVYPTQIKTTFCWSRNNAPDRVL